MNAPDTALVLAGVGSSVSFSNFGSGGYGVGPDGNLRTESAAETATRATAIWLDGGGSGAWYNRIQYGGTAAINLVGSGQYAYGNSLFQNRYELSDVSHDPLVCGSTGVPCVQQGGQLTVWTTSSNASVPGNVIDGNNWPAEDGTLPPSANGCPFGNGSAFNPGVEAYGTGHYFYNNEVVNNIGSGMQFAGASDTQTKDITISSWNPWDASDTARYIEQNHQAGIAFLGPVTNSSFTKPAVGVTLDNVLVGDNSKQGIVLDSVTPDFVTNWNIGGQYVGFVNYGCLIGNTLGSAYTPGTTLPNATPTPPNQYRSGPPGGGVMTACPPTAWPQLPPPAASQTPGWSW
jgi:hypothetical protein